MSRRICPGLPFRARGPRGPEEVMRTAPEHPQPEGFLHRFMLVFHFKNRRL